MTQTASKHITKSAVERMRPGETIRDTELAGFVVRNQKGQSVYYVNKRVRGGDPVWVRIGTHGAPWTATSARRKALVYASLLAQGINPNDTQRLEKEKFKVDKAIGIFISEHGPKLKPRTREEYQRLIDNDVVPRLGSRKVDALTRTHVSRFHNALADTPRKANFALAVLSKFMSWCEEHHLRPENSNPCRHIKKFRERRRERYLSFDELNRLGAVLHQAETENTESPFVIAAIRLYLFTGARRDEILSLKWAHADTNRKLLRLPDSKTGEKFIRLSEPAVAVLSALPHVVGNPYVIVGNRTSQHLVNIQKPWSRLRKQAGLGDLRLHDLRHSFASIIASGGGSLQKIGDLLGHKNIQTTMRYAHLFDDPVRQLNEDAGMIIADAMDAQKIAARAAKQPLNRPKLAAKALN